MERSVELAKDVAARLEVDLFAAQRRGRFSEMVQNCLICAYQTECRNTVMERLTLDAPLPHCRNRAYFSDGD